jgi:hypothetical protein
VHATCICGLGNLTVAPKDEHGHRRAPADSSRGTKNWYRASLFRNSGESCRNINIVETDRRHSSVLSALVNRATQFRNKGEISERGDCVHSWMLDKTGMINTRLLNHEKISQQEQIGIRGVSDEVLQVHGVLSGYKEDGIK